jgi:hypothetical protein
VTASGKRRKNLVKRVIRTIMVLLVLAVAMSLNAAIWELDFTYYSDSTFACEVGHDFNYCDNTNYQDGTAGPARIWDKYSCSTSAHLEHRCQVSDGCGGWNDVTCPF